MCQCGKLESKKGTTFSSKCFPLQLLNYIYFVKFFVLYPMNTLEIAFLLENHKKALSSVLASSSPTSFSSVSTRK